ncbi:MAG: two-component system sensor histidine kinase AlgZ [Polaribacter sp.]|jgi:two-component system sensor histidine kinase AlgZ
MQNKPSTLKQSNKTLAEFFLPDFCNPQSILMVILIGELLAVIFTLLNTEPYGDLWQLLGLYSISLQTVGLSSVSILCLSRTYLSTFSDFFAGLVSLSIILFTTFIFTYISIVFYHGSLFDLTQHLQLQYLIKNWVIAGLIGSVLLRYFYLQQQYVKTIGLESAARLDALQARIRPHFLFNSMNVIASLTQIDPKLAETAIEDLSDLIRATLDNNDDLIPLSKELENGKKYLSIESLRLGDRMKVEWNVEDGCEQILVPPLSVQPLLENGVYHGIQLLTSGGTLQINVTKNDTHLIIRVTNPVPEETQKHVSHKGQGIAINNIEQRLEVIFKTQASITFNKINQRYQVEMKIPLDKN